MVELRARRRRASPAVDAGERARAARRRAARRCSRPTSTGARLWLAGSTPAGRRCWPTWAAHGAPIRYGYVERAWPLAEYQTIFATEPGSAEMPSAGRPFTPELITRAASRAGVGVAPRRAAHRRVVAGGRRAALPRALRGAARRPRRAVNATRGRGGRVIAVGTTVVRALETVARADGTVAPRRRLDRPRRHAGARRARRRRPAHRLARARGVAPAHARGRRRARARSSAPTTRRSSRGYLWHEFGDVHLLLP